MEPAANPWDDNADVYVRGITAREPEYRAPGSMLTRVLDLLGDLDGRVALDAGCGEGLLARAMADRGARVTGIDLSPRLIHHARVKDPANLIDYRVGDLSLPHPEFSGRFDAIGSFLVLNDVRDHRGFARTLADLSKPGARLALALNNP